MKDEDSGDDFSHTQAHNGQATQGEYRVKLPDGRLQIVSYTADSQGYKAEVKYDEDKSSQPQYNQVTSSQYNEVAPVPQYNELAPVPQNHLASSEYNPVTHARFNQVPVQTHTPIIVRARPIYRVIPPQNPNQPYKAALIAYAPYKSTGNNVVNPIYIYRAALPVQRLVNYPRHQQ